MASSVSSFPLPFRASKLFITFSFWRRGRRRRERGGNRGKKIRGSAKKIPSPPYFYSLPPFSSKRHRNSLPVFIAGKKTKKTFFSRNLPAKRQSLDISPPPPFFAVVVFRSRGKEGVDKIGIGGDFWTSRFSKTNVEI